ncbi:unnamed protein product [Linum trigynum]|uniref:RNase H type-1 domain-containing protein n=1 Tax=Linum trigynum TaxID=586398 RepID=A0AAV2GPL7_9ROSI
MDSRGAMELIQSASEGSPYCNLVFHIRQLLGREWKAVIKHVLREANVVVDFLASMGHSYNVDVITSPISSLNYLLLHNVLTFSPLELF